MVRIELSISDKCKHGQFNAATSQVTVIILNINNVHKNLEFSAKMLNVHLTETRTLTNFDFKHCTGNQKRNVEICNIIITYQTRSV